jgi:uncharacterized protein YndB with AHSA1/START domain
VDVPGNGHGFTVNDGHAPVTFNSDSGTVTVNPAGHHPVVVGGHGGVATTHVTTDGHGGAVVNPGGDGRLTIGKTSVTFNAGDGHTPVTVHHDGGFDAGAINKAPDGTVTLNHPGPDGTPVPVGTAHPDGSATISHNGTGFNVSPNGRITHDNPAHTGPIPQPTPGNPVNLGNSTVHVNPDGKAEFTFAHNGTTATVTPGGTTLNHPGVTVHTTPGKVDVNGTDPAHPVSTSTIAGPDGHPATTVTTGAGHPQVTVDHNTGSTTVGAHDGTPTTTVTPNAGGGTGTRIHSGATHTTVNDNGASAAHNGTPLVSTDTSGQHPVTTAHTGGDTTLTTDQGNSRIHNGDNSLNVDHTGGKVTTGPSEITHTHNPGAAPTADVKPSDPNAAPFQAHTTGNGAEINAGGVKTTGTNNNPVTFEHPDTPTAVFHSPGDGSVSVVHASGDTATANPDHSFQVSNHDGTAAHGAPSTDPAAGHTTTTTVDHGDVSTTVKGDDNGLTHTTGKPGAGGAPSHTVSPDGTVKVGNPPSKADITVHPDHATVVTPEKTTVGNNRIDVHGNPGAHGPAGTTVTTPPVHPVHQPGSTTHLNPDGKVDVTYGPVKATYSAGGPEHIHGNPTHTVGTGGQPVHVNEVTGNGKGSISVQAPGNGPTISHEPNPNISGGGKSTIDTANATITKTPQPKDATQAPEVFSARHNNGGPTVEVPVGGKGSTVHGPNGPNGDYAVVNKGDGTFEVSGGGGPDDKVAVAPDGTLTDHNGVPVKTPDGGAPGSQSGSLNGGTLTVHNDGAGNVTVTPHGVDNQQTTISNGTATHTDDNATITQHPDGKATFTTNDNHNTTLDLGPGGVEGTHTSTNDIGQPNSYDIDLGDSGGVKVVNTTTDHTTKVGYNGSYSEQHAPAHDYHATFDPSSMNDFKWKTGYSVVGGAVQNVATAGYQIANGADPTTAFENAGMSFAHVLPNQMANRIPHNEPIFAGKSIDAAIGSLPVRVFNGEQNAHDQSALDHADPGRIKTREIAGHDPGAHAATGVSEGV